MQNKSVRKVLSWWNGWDTTNMSEPDWMGALEEASHPWVQVNPVKTLRERHYGDTAQPLVTQPEYQGDFLNKLRDEDPMVVRVMKKALNADPSNIYDVYMPSDLLKHQEHPYPNDQTDEFIEFNTPFNMIEDNFGAEPYDYQRGIPEMTEDLRERQFDLQDAPEPEKEDRIVQARRVVASFLVGVSPQQFSLDLNSRYAIKLQWLTESQIYSKTRGVYHPIEIGGVSVRLKRAEPENGRWFFTTYSSGEKYTTVFQFTQRRNVKAVNKLDVRVSCSCPSFLFYGAQFNALMNDYLYGKLRPKFTEPRLRDPQKRFRACKHILACIPVVQSYRIQGKPEAYKFKYEIEKRVPTEEVKIPVKFQKYEKAPELKGVIEGWEDFSPQDRKNSIVKIDNPDYLTYLAHKFPETSTAFVAERLRDISESDSFPEVTRRKARKALESIDKKLIKKVPKHLDKFLNDKGLMLELGKWEKWSPTKKKVYVMGLGDPEMLEFVAHRYPDDASGYVAERLKQLAKESPDPEVKRDSENVLREIF